MNAHLLALVTTEGVLLVDDTHGELRATLRVLREAKGWYAFTPDGLFDWGGDAATLHDALSCRARADVFPLEACEDRLRVPGLLAMIARGERPALDPLAP